MEDTNTSFLTLRPAYDEESDCTCFEIPRFPDFRFRPDAAMFATIRQTVDLLSFKTQSLVSVSQRTLRLRAHVSMSCSTTAAQQDWTYGSLTPLSLISTFWLDGVMDVCEPPRSTRA